jgi:ornithine cyclodeaminase
MRILTASDVAVAITMPEAIAAMRVAFRQISSGEAVVPSRLATPTDYGVTLSMPAYLPGEALSVKVVSVNPGNAEYGLAAIQGAVLVLDHRTGAPLALIEGRALTALRTGAASGLATDLLARRDSSVLTIFGTGAQSAQQIAAVRAVRDIGEVRVVKRNENPARALEGADIVVTATNSATPVFDGALLSPGTHINAIGSYRPDMRELDEDTVRRAKLVVDSREAARAEAGELQGEVRIHAELGEILLGRREARTSGDELTVLKSVGNAAQDAAIARAILDAAIRRGLGQIFDFG